MTRPEAPRSLTLTYFDFHGGRGEPARIALSIGGVPFTDDRVGHASWAERKPRTPFGGLPVLEVDGVLLSESNAINRLVGRLAGLYPEGVVQAACCDEAMDAVESLYAVLTPSFGLRGDEQKAAREKLLEGALPRFLRGIAGLLERGGGEWFADGRLTVADLKVMGLTRHLGAGVLDHIPTDLVARLTPTLDAHRARVLAHPGVRAYYAKFGL